MIGAAALFSTGGAAIKACSMTSWQVASFRALLAAAALLLLVPGTRRGWRPATLLVGGAYAATNVLFVTANKLTTAANTIFLQSTAPLYLLLLGPWLLREPVRPRDLAFLAALAAGMACFLLEAAEPLATATDPVAGNLLAAGSGLSYALTLAGLRWLGSRPGAGPSDAAAAAVAGSFLAGLLCLPFALPLPAAPPADWAILAYLGVFQIALAYRLITAGIREVPAFEASLLVLIEPVLNPVWTWLVHGERPGPWALAGGGVILGATLAKTGLDLRAAPPGPPATAAGKV